MRKIRPQIMCACALFCLGLSVIPAEAKKRGESYPAFPLLFHVAQAGGKAVRSQKSIQAQVRRANAIFKPSGVSFSTAGTKPLAAEHTKIRTRRDRHKLATRLHDKVINCFMVEELHNVDEEGVIRGVHWRSKVLRDEKEQKVHYVIVSKIAKLSVLAHELGHFFGNKHSQTPGNIMSYTSAEGLPFFDVAQIRRIRRFAKRFREQGEIRENAE